MKKLIAILLVVVMMFSLTACKSKEQKAADQYLNDLEALLEEVITAVEDEDMDAIEDLMEEMEDLGEEGEDIYKDLKKKDKDAAKEFKNDVEDMMEEITDEIYEIAGGAGTELGTGGMHSKIEAASFAMRHNIPMVITAGADPKVIYSVLEGEFVGTLFSAK